MILAGAPRLFCSFRVNGRLFGVDILDVREVTTETTFTHIPHAPPEVLGLVNIRGHIHLILDLRRLLGLSVAAPTPLSRVVLFKPVVGQALGVIVDEIGEIQAPGPQELEQFSAIQHQGLAGTLGRADLIDFVGRTDEELLLILNPRRFLLMVDQSNPETG
jgi:purine-binding chemotaxis protein CheW